MFKQQVGGWAAAHLYTCTLKVIELCLQHGVNCIVYTVYLNEAFKGDKDQANKYSQIQTTRATHVSSFVDSKQVTNGDVKVWPFIPTSASPQTVWSEDSFTLLKITEVSGSFCLCEYYLLIFTILVIKMDN